MRNPARHKTFLAGWKKHVKKFKILLPQSHNVLHKSLINSGKMKIEKVQVTGTGPCNVKKVPLNRQALPQTVK